MRSLRYSDGKVGLQHKLVKFYQFDIRHLPSSIFHFLYSEDEKKLIEEILNNALDVLTDDDRLLPQVQSIRPLLLRGIGVHHGGLLPILKETVEILFAENLLKILFATETFAMGLNMPARTVLFTNCRKFDGKQNRFVSRP